MLNQKGSKKRFLDEIKAEFSSRFWLSFKSVATENVWVKARRTVLVKAYHPLVKEFLKGVITKGTLPEDSKINISELTEVRFSH